MSAAPRSSIRNDRAAFAHLTRVDPKAARHALAVGGVSRIEVRNLPQLDLPLDRFHVLHEVIDQSCLVVRREKPEEVSGLRVIVVAFAVVIASNESAHSQRSFLKG